MTHPRIDRCRLLLIVALVAGSAAAEPVRTHSGWVDGVTEPSYRVFKGIPFAAPPVGDLRWHAPQPVRSWSGVRPANRFSSICPQLGAYPPESAPESTSEDCLYLNIWAPPGTAAAPLPVMVWIYGGGLEKGSASAPLYAGDQLTQKKVMLVTANYRLGALGFLALPELSKESSRGISGNYGLLDQIAALRWVHDNIAAFGGDPANVTVFGQSSGAISISALVASPLAKGLFQRAIGESGGLFEPVELASGFNLHGAEIEGEQYLHAAGAQSLQALRQMSSDTILKTPFIPHFIVDGYALTRPPFDAYEHHTENDVDLLIGSNADEGQLFFFNDDLTVKKVVTRGNVGEFLAHDFSTPVVWLMGAESGADDAQARAGAAAFERDMRFRWDMWTWAAMATNNGKKNVFYYQFSRAPPFDSSSRYAGLGATHGMEMPYVFEHLDPSAAAWTPHDRELSADMAAYWTRFASSGNPNGPGLPGWPVFDPAAGEAMDFGDRIAVEPIVHPERLSRIGRVYATARFVFRYRYPLSVMLAGLVLSTLGAIILGLLRWRRRRLR